ncbi:MAG: SAF domain-containing protein [Moorellaceae bacterium]
MPIIKGRKMLPAVLIIAIGVLASVAAWIGITHQIRAGQITIAIAVPRRDIVAYVPITANDLTLKEVPAAAVDGYTVRDASEAAGKMAAVTLYAGKPIDRRDLLNSDNGNYAAGYEVVGVVTDAARSAGVKSGDVVDVYCLRVDQTAQASGVIPGIKAASDARVLRVCDEQGQPIDGSGENASGGVIGGVAGAVTGGVAPKTPKVVYLLVRAEEVPNVTPGAWDKGAVVVLVRKPYAGINGSSQGISGQAEQQQSQPPVEQPSVSGGRPVMSEKAPGNSK